MKPWLVWFIAGACLLVVEMLTPGIFFFSCFGMGAFIAAILAYYHFPLWVLWSEFIVFSLVLVFIARPFILKMTKGESRASNADELIGKDAVVLKPIRPHFPGLVKIGGETWRASSEQDLSEGSLAVILRVEGTLLVVRKK